MAIDETDTQQDETMTSKISGKEIRSCVTLGVGTTFVFSAFLAIQNLQGSLNDESGLGVISLGCLYAAAIISAVFAPLVISLIGIKSTVIMAYLGHLVYVISNFYSSFYTLIPSSVIIGLITGPLWTSYGTYLANCASSLSVRNGIELHVTLSKVNGMFYAFFESSSIFGNLLSSIVLYQGTYNTSTANASFQHCGANNCPEEGPAGLIAAPDSKTVYIMLGVFLGLVVSGLVVITLFLLPTNGNKDMMPSKNVKKSIRKMVVVFIRTDIKFLVPIFGYIAMAMTLCFAELTKSFISCPLGIENVGYVMSVFGTCAGSMAFLSSVIGKVIKRYILITFAATMELSLLLWMYNWVPDGNDYVKVYVLAALFGISQGVWKAQFGAVVGEIFADYKQEAFALYELVKYIGFTVACAYSNILCMTVKLLITMIILSTGMILYAVVELRFARRKKANEECYEIESSCDE